LLLNWHVAVGIKEELLASRNMVQDDGRGIKVDNTRWTNL
jgi:hypothetical protein